MTIYFVLSFISINSRLSRLWHKAFGDERYQFLIRTTISTPKRKITTKYNFSSSIFYGIPSRWEIKGMHTLNLLPSNQTNSHRICLWCAREMMRTQTYAISRRSWIKSHVCLMSVIKLWFLYWGIFSTPIYSVPCIGYFVLFVPWWQSPNY